MQGISVTNTDGVAWQGRKSTACSKNVNGRGSYHNVDALHHPSELTHDHQASQTCKVIKTANWPGQQWTGQLAAVVGWRMLPTVTFQLILTKASRSLHGLGRMHLKAPPPHTHAHSTKGARRRQVKQALALPTLAYPPRHCLINIMLARHGCARPSIWSSSYVLHLHMERIQPTTQE